MNKKIATLSATAVLLFSPFVALAVLNSISTIINNIMNWIVWPLFVGAVVIMFVWAGFLFSTAAGDPSKIQTAKKAVLWAIIGVVVGIMAFSLVSLIKNILGV